MKTDEVRNPLVICVDFDGTVVSHEYPCVGGDVGAVPVLKDLVDKGCKIVLFTMRSGERLDDAVRWFVRRGIPLFGVNENPEQKTWTTSPKAYGHIYIDDAALGCPLVTSDRLARETGRPYVDWAQIRKLLVEAGVLDG